MKNKFLKMIICMVLVCTIFMCGFNDVAQAAEKRTSWVSRDGKTLYRATVTSENVKSKVKPLSDWANKRPKIALSISVSTSRTLSMSSSAQFTGTAKGTLTELSASIGVSVGVAVSYTTEYSYTVPADEKPGKYRAVLVWSGARVTGVVTSEPNGPGNGGGQIMSKDVQTKLKPQKKVINTSSVAYAPKRGSAYVDLQTP